MKINKGALDDLEHALYLARLQLRDNDGRKIQAEYPESNYRKAAIDALSALTGETVTEED